MRGRSVKLPDTHLAQTALAWTSLLVLRACTSRSSPPFPPHSGKIPFSISRRYTTQPTSACRGCIRASYALESSGGVCLPPRNVRDLEKCRIPQALFVHNRKILMIPAYVHQFSCRPARHHHGEMDDSEHKKSAIVLHDVSTVSR